MIPGALAAGFLTTLLATPLVRAAACRTGFLDRPNPRSSHRRVTPRGGGLALVAGLGVALLAGRAHPAHPALPALLGGLAVVAAVGLLDDRLGLAPLLRLLSHLGAAALLVAHTGGFDRLPLPPPLDLPTGPLGGPLAVLWVVAVVNFVNFMDGIDGLAALQGVVTGLTLAAAGLHPSATLLGAGLAGASAGFLVFNWAPARIFLGDVGSGALGYTLASVPLLGPGPAGGSAVLLAGISLWLFLADATTCLLGRAARGERWYEAHRRHLYQRWVAAGAGHARVAAWIGLGSAATSVAALLAWRSGVPSGAWAGVVLGGALFGLEWRAVVRAERRAAGRDARSAGR